MKTTHRRRALKLYTVAAVAVVGSLLSGCREGPGPGDEPDFRGTWTAEDTVTVFGRTLVTQIELVITDADVTLTATTSEGESVVHRVTATGTYTFAQDSVSFSYTGGQQSEDQGDGTFDVDTMVEIEEDDLSDLTTDLGGSHTYVLTDTTFTMDSGTTSELEFTKTDD